MAFVQGPDPYLIDMDATFSCAVHPEQPAIIDAEHRVFVNYEVYYVGSDAAREEFEAEPWRYTGGVTDPVTRERFIPGSDSPHRLFDGRQFYLASPENAATFDEDPEMYGTLQPGMRPKS